MAKPRGHKPGCRCVVCARRSRGGSKRSTRRSGGTSRGVARIPKVEHVAAGAAPPLAIGGLLAPPLNEGLRAPNWGGSPAVNAARGDTSDMVYNLKQNIPFVGTDPGHRGNRAAVGLGLIVAAAPTIKKLPVVGKVIRKLTTVRVGRKTYKLFGGG